MTVAVSVPPPAHPPSLWLDPALLAGQLAPSSLAGYRRDVARYLHFCGDGQPASEAASLARWRTFMAQDTRLSPYTINRRLAAVKRLVAEAASQGYADSTAAEAFRRVAGVQAKALKERMKTLPRTRLTPRQMREICEAPDRLTLIGWRDRALLHTLASSGCRVSEVVSLQAAQLASREGSFFLEVLGKNQTAARLAPLSSEAYAAIQAWLARRPVESSYVFTSFAGKGHRPTTRPMHLTAVTPMKPPSRATIRSMGPPSRSARSNTSTTSWNKTIEQSNGSPVPC